MACVGSGVSIGVALRDKTRTEDPTPASTAATPDGWTAPAPMVGRLDMSTILVADLLFRSWADSADQKQKPAASKVPGHMSRMSRLASEGIRGTGD